MSYKHLAALRRETQRGVASVACQNHSVAVVAFFSKNICATKEPPLPQVGCFSLKICATKRTTRYRSTLYELLYSDCL